MTQTCLHTREGPQDLKTGGPGRVLFILRTPWALALNQSTQDSPQGGHLQCPKVQRHQRSTPVCSQELWAWAKTVAILSPHQEGPEVSVLNIGSEAGPS